MGCTHSQYTEDDSNLRMNVLTEQLSGDESISSNTGSIEQDHFMSTGFQTKASKSCCGSYCRVLNHHWCCEHAGTEFDSYCELCRSHNMEHHLNRQREQLALSKKLIEDAMEAGLEVALSGEECPVCLETAVIPCELLCGHMICASHMEKLSNCPLCRHPIDSSEGNENTGDLVIG